MMVLQLDYGENLGWCWGDAGVIYYWIPEVDLAAGRFGRVWLVLQCS